LIVDRTTVRDPIEISAWTAAGEIMGIRIKDTFAEGVQFHPESILTTEGKAMIKNFLIGSD
jgi:anthranilate/para-aminobenzoate synthase component II